MAKPKKSKQTPEESTKDMSALHNLLRDKYPTATTTQSASDFLSTGSPLLDRSLGGRGLPFGRIVELYGAESGGKTTLMLSVCKEAQTLGHACLYVDYEHALSLEYAESLGVDVSPDKFIWIQPANLEEGSQIIQDSLKTGLVKVVVVDSIAAAVPSAELAGDAGDSHMGLQARLTGQMLRQVTPLVSAQNALFLVVNQIRQKIGVQWGCCHYNTRIDVEGEGSVKIGKLVNRKLPARVMSFDPETLECSYQRVVEFHDNGKTDRFLQIMCESHTGSGRSNFSCTPEHIVFKQEGSELLEVPAGTIKPGDTMLGRAKLILSPWQRELAIASVLGDGNLRKTSKNVNIRFGHGIKQAEYLDWKAKQFQGLIGKGVSHTDYPKFDVIAAADMLDVYKEAYSPSGRVISNIVLNELTVRGVAIWYLDDGTFGGHYSRWGKGKCSISAQSYTFEELEKLCDTLEKLGLPRPEVSPRKHLSWYGKNSFEFQRKIAPFVHPSMEYKIHPDLRGQFIDVNEPSVPVKYIMLPVKVLDVWEKPKTRGMRKFDLTIENNATYLADGVGVHNSNEATCAGNALKFYATIRLDIRRKETIKSGETSIGIKSRVKVVKNKIAAPFQETELTILFGQGIDSASDVLTLALESGNVVKSGAWFALKDGTRMGQGEVNALNYLRDKPTLWPQLIKKDEANDEASE